MPENELEQKLAKVKLEDTEPTAVEDEFAGLKKKKKSSKKKLQQQQQGFDEAGSDEEAAKENAEVLEGEDEGEDAFSGLKKKKKSKKSSKKVTFGEGEDEVGEGEDEQAELAKEGEPWLGTDRDYHYSELLDRLYAELREHNPELAGEKRRFTIVPPQMVREGSKKSLFVNSRDIASRLSRPLEHMTQFIYAELGTSGSTDDNGSLVIKGRFQQKQMETVLRKYIIEYVTCKTCKSGETDLVKENRITYVKCKICGSSRSVAAIKTGFQAQTTKRSAARK